MRHAKSRLTIHQLVDGQNGKDGQKGDKGQDGLTPQPNLLLDAHLPQNLGAWSKSTSGGGSVVYEDITPPITGVSVWSATARTANESIAELRQSVSLIVGKSYTISVYAKGALSGWVICYPIGQHYSLSEMQLIEDSSLSDGWKRYAVTFVADKSGTTNVYLRSWYQSAQRQSGTVYFAAPKLEEGKVATPWQRAQADFKGKDGQKGDKGEKGNAGDKGVGVTAVVTEYVASTSASIAPSSGWSTTMPTWQQGQYLWTRSRVTFSDGRITTTSPQVDSAWKKLSDLAWEQANMAYLKQVFEQRAGIEGGLLFGAMLQMRDVPKNGASAGEVAAYFNGLRSAKVGNAPRPALALGVNNFGKADEKETTALNFDGSGHIGDLHFDGAGTLSTRGDDGTVLTELTRQPRCDINALVQRSERKMSISPISLSTRGTGYNNSGRELRVTSPYGRGKIEYTIMVSGTPEYSEAVARGDMEPFISSVWAEAILERKVGYNSYVTYLKIGTEVTYNGRKNASGSIDLINLPIGTYRISFQVNSEHMTNAQASFYASTAVYTEGLVTPFTAIAGDGIMSFHSSEQYTYIKDGKLTIKGDFGFPSVVACGKVSIEGQLETKWGKAIRAWRRSTGEYLIYHTIGHTNYSIVITPLGNGNLMQGQLAAQTGDVAWCFIKDVQNGCRMVNTPFTFAILAW